MVKPDRVSGLGDLGELGIVGVELLEGVSRKVEQVLRECRI